MKIIGAHIIDKKSEIPQILNGVSANTIYYLINKKHIDSLQLPEDNSSYIDHPCDYDDFGRCYLAYKVFGWSDDDFKIAIENSKLLKLGECYIEFFERFEELTDLYSKDKKSVDTLIKKIFKR